MANVIRGKFGKEPPSENPGKGIREKAVNYLYQFNVTTKPLIGLFSPLFSREGGLRLSTKIDEESSRVATKPAPFEVHSLYDAVGIILDLADATGKSGTQICRDVAACAPDIHSVRIIPGTTEIYKLTEGQKMAYADFMEQGENTRDNLPDEEQYLHLPVTMQPYLGLDG